jgi:hypothetical protein
MKETCTEAVPQTGSLFTLPATAAVPVKGVVADTGVVLLFAQARSAKRETVKKVMITFRISLRFGFSTATLNYWDEAELPALRPGTSHRRRRDPGPLDIHSVPSLRKPFDFDKGRSAGAHRSEKGRA